VVSYGYIVGKSGKTGVRDGGLAVWVVWFAGPAAGAGWTKAFRFERFSGWSCREINGRFRPFHLDGSGEMAGGGIRVGRVRARRGAAGCRNRAMHQDLRWAVTHLASLQKQRTLKRKQLANFSDASMRRYPQMGAESKTAPERREPWGSANPLLDFRVAGGYGGSGGKKGRGRNLAG